ncbi:hypothetical protein SASPL_137242 [Salvia splendens]|uniref:Uncharacterized protein n=1 Tax=Salvia splendens TaxID=180675 RepID=A0A8X8WUW0_SALSN|nr:hypothetical protein SASPL_137242 [Salvia splendens]
MAGSSSRPSLNVKINLCELSFRSPAKNLSDAKIVKRICSGFPDVKFCRRNRNLLTERVGRASTSASSSDSGGDRREKDANWDADFKAALAKVSPFSLGQGAAGFLLCFFLLYLPVSSPHVLLFWVQKLEKWALHAEKIDVVRGVSVMDW